MTRAVTLAEIADGAVLTADSSNNRVGIGSIQPTAKLDVGGNAQIGAAITMFSSSGIVSATSFHGDGSNLSGITAGATLSAASGAQRVVVTSLTSGTMTAAGTDADLAWNSTTNTLSATNINVSGTLTYEDVTNVDSVGLVTARGGLNVTGGKVTIGTGSTVGLGSTAYFRDNAKAIFGDGEDLEIYHDTSSNYIDISQPLYFRSTHGSGTQFYFQATSGENSLVLNHNGSVDLYFDNNKKLETTTTGITITGGVQVGSGQSFGANGPTAVYYGDGSNLTGISAGITTTKYSPTANAIIQIGLGTAQHHELTLTAGFTTITTSGGSFGDSHSLVLIQPSSGIATVGFSTFFQFPSGATPAMSEGSSKVDLVSFVVKDVTGNTGTGATELLASAGLNYS